MDNIIFLKGERIHLRALEEKDLNDIYLQWLNDEETCKGNSHAIFPNSQYKLRSYFNSLQNQQNIIVFAIIHTESQKHIGNVSLQNINWISRNAEFAILLGDKEFWGDGYGIEASRLAIAYSFERLNLHRIYCGTLDGNKAMMGLAQKLNMTEEGRRREAVFKHGKYIDIIEYGVLNNEFTS
jgi:[ribosomal protein S5]-alanine N-acetyltransferase